MPKQILSWQPKFNTFLQSYLLATCNTLHFYTKKESVIILKNTKLWRKNLAIFHNVKKQRFIFYITHFFLIFVDKGIFFQEYKEMELKTFFIIFNAVSNGKNKTQQK